MQGRDKGPVSAGLALARRILDLLPQLSGDLRAALSAQAVLARRNVIGGTAPERVGAEVERWRIRMAEWAEGWDELDDFDPDEDDPAMETDHV